MLDLDVTIALCLVSLFFCAVMATVSALMRHK